MDQPVEKIPDSLSGSSRPAPAFCLDFNKKSFAEAFNIRPFLIRHTLADSPQFRLARLVDLARKLPTGSIEYNPGDISVDHDPAMTPATGLSAEETIRRIDSCRSWMVLKHVEREQEYQNILDRCLDEIRPFSEQVAAGMTNRQGFVFISSPNSVTPYHIDPEYNFLLQISGTKTVHVFDGANRQLLSEIELEGFLSGGHRNLHFEESYQKQATTFTLRPGDGLHIPVTAPHWVRNEGETSISFSITFRTPASDRRSIIYSMNARLRRYGVTPVPFGRSKWRDFAKASAMRALRKAGM